MKLLNLLRRRKAAGWFTLSQHLEKSNHPAKRAHDQAAMHKGGYVAVRI